jgi:phenylacetate-CoA ligase
VNWLNTYRLLRQMNERLRWTRQELDHYRLWRFREVVRNAYYGSPFYRRKYQRHGFHPDDLKTITDIRKIPILTKTELRSTDPLEILTPKQNVGLITEVTGGSTGEALRIYRTWRDLWHIKAKVIRAFQQTGFRLYHPQAVLKSSRADLTGKHWFEQFGILRKYWLSVTDPPEVNLKRLREICPKHVHGYPSGLVEIADLLLERGETFRIPVICTGAEVLDEAARDRIQQAFLAEVFDLYASREVGNIAWECSAHRGMHINDDAMIVELVDDEEVEVPDGVEGRILVTYLDGYDFPFIRYDLGDLGIRIPGECSCGVRFGRLARITGRSDSRIRLPSGQWLSGLVFQELRLIPWLKAFRVLQEDPESIRLQIVARKEPDQTKLNDLISFASGLVRGELRVVPEIVSHLNRDPSDKFRAVICRLETAGRNQR